MNFCFCFCLQIILSFIMFYTNLFIGDDVNIAIAQKVHGKWDKNKQSSVSLIAPLVSGVAGLSASSSSKADTLNIWCKNYRMWQLLETINTLFPAVNFLKCVVTEVILFSIVVFKTLDIWQGSVATHLRCGGIFSDSIITNFLLIFTVK